MRSPILITVAAFLCLSAASVAEAGSARLPEPLVAHVRVASPQKLLEAFDSVLGASVKDTPAAGQIPPGIFSLMLFANSPLPIAAWNYYAEMHLLFLAKAEGELAMAAVLESEGLDAISAALEDKGEMTEDRGRKTLVAKLNKSATPYCFQELSGGRVLIAKNADLADAFQTILREWTPALDSERAVACQVDLANLQSIFGPQINRGFAVVREQTAMARKEMDNLRGALPEAVDSADSDLLVTFCEDSLNVADRLVAEIEALLPMLEGVRLEFDSANGRLLLAAALTGAKDSRLDRYIAGIADAPNPDFPFVAAFPARSLFYYYQATDETEANAALRDFTKELAGMLLARTSPKTAAEVAGIVDAAAKAGLRATGGAAYTTESGGVASANYMAWDRPDDVLPLVRRVADLAVRLNDKGMALIEKYFRKTLAEIDAKKEGETKGDEALGEWVEKFRKHGIQPIIKPVLASDDGEEYGVPYANLVVNLDFEQFVPPGMEQLPQLRTILARMRAIEDNLRFLWVRWKDAVVFSHGILDPDNLKAEIADITEPVAEGEATFAGLVRDDGYVKTITHRQTGFTMIRPSQAFARLLIDHVHKTLADDEAAIASSWKVFNGMEENDTFIYAWSGVEDGGMRASLLIPAVSINNVVKNVYRQKDDLTVLLLKIYAATRAGGL